MRRLEETAGLDEAGAWAVASALMAERLDHARPLWAIDLVGPLADGREVIVVRIHHAMADGMSCVRFLAEVLWDEAERRPAPASGVARASAAPTDRTARGWTSWRQLPGAVGRELGHRPGASPLARRIGSGARARLHRLPAGRAEARSASRAPGT